MSRRKDRDSGHAAADKHDTVLRLAVAATTLGMTMGIAPATVLGADAAASGTAETAPRIKIQKVDKIERADASVHKSEQGKASSAGASPNAQFLKMTPAQAAPGRPPAAAHKDAKPDAASHKVEKPDAAAHKVESPDAVFHKDESPAADAQQASPSGQPVKPQYDIATTKK